MEPQEPHASDFQVKRDGYRKARGGNSAILDIHCSKCDRRLMVYQKDGIGALLRSYLDRILWPEGLASLSNNPNIRSTKDIPNLKCDGCGSLIGTPMVYELERRFAYRLVRGSFSKQKLR